jgi:hypothetical protein
MLTKLDSVKAVVLDFDCTITREHTGGRAESADVLTSDYIKNNIKNGFVSFVRGALRKNLRLYIATYGDDSFAEREEDVAGHALVDRYMRCLFGEGQTIFRGPERDEQGAITKYHNTIAKLSGDRKAFHWEIIMNQLKGEVPAHEILFLDDQMSNLEYARELGCQCIVQGSAEYAASISADERVFDLLNI